MINCFMLNYINFNCRKYILSLPTAILRNVARNVLIDIAAMDLSPIIYLQSHKTHAFNTGSPFFHVSELCIRWRHRRTSSSLRIR